MKRSCGQMTVFLSLSMLSLMALFSVCLESARCACVDYLCGQSAASSLRSVYAAYQGELLREYGLLACQGRENGTDTLEEQVLHYAQKYLDPAANTFLPEGDRIRLKSLAVQDTDTVYLTEGRGGVFAKSALAYMKSAGLSLILQDVLERLGLYNSQDGSGLLETLKNMLDDKDSSLEGILDSYKDVKEQAAQLQEEARKKAEEEETEYIPPPGNSEDVKTDLLEQIKAIRKNGLIAIITGQEELSAYSWEKEGLPSGLPQAEKALHTDYAPLPDNLLDHLLLGEYVIHQMGCFTDAQTGGSAYEAEYVITGRKTDKASFELVVGEILLIRMGFNLAYLASDGEKMMLAELTAIAIMSFLALPQLVGILKWVILSAWALAESIVDLRGLVRGRKVALWKTAQSWKLKSMKLDLAAEGGGSKGLSYQDYLRVLYALGNPETQCYRMMDVIQERLRLSLPAFELRNYMVKSQITLQAVSGYLYIDMPLIRDLFGRGSARQYTKEAVYGYERR